jgi:hypothetical protein
MLESGRHEALHRVLGVRVASEEIGGGGQEHERGQPYDGYEPAA